ncbi:MAG: hypothetical protein E7611_00715 [Ruminococcaceae bacterium]|nr:hypothetical protein [Oscillospiraceae bacterium]
MKIIKKISVFVIVALLLCTLFSLSVFATDAPAEQVTEGATESVNESATEGAEKTGKDGKLNMSLKPESFNDRLGYAVQGTVTGIVMVFAVLTLLTLILYISKYVFYDIPNKGKERARDAKNAGSIQPAEPIVVSDPVPVTPAAPAEAQDDGELVAVITAAVAAMIESSEYKNEFVGGFRVVSFKRSEKTAWNRK